MAGNLRSFSQIWNKKQNDPEKENPVTNASHSRRNLEKQFSTVNTSDSNGAAASLRKSLRRSRNALSSVNIGNVPWDTRKLLQAGAVKVHQKFQDVKTSIGVLSQRLKNPTRRRERLIANSPYTPARDGNVDESLRARQILGRTPTRLYSPFGIETPPNVNHHHVDLVCPRPNLGPAFQPPTMYSPTQALPSDVKKVKEGMEDFNRAAEKAVRRSLRQQMAVESR